MIRLITTLLFVVATLQGCNDSSFEDNIKNGVEDEPQPVSEDASGDPAASEVTVIPEAIVEDSSLRPRNPAAASDSAIFSFVAAQEVASSFKVSLDDKMVMTKFNLKNAYSDVKNERKQVDRDQLTQTVKQGSDGDEKTETFDQEEKKGCPRYSCGD